ncbi:DHA2 family efflux MFS transporter permease subunit [Amycolatopsis sp. A1MSW2902]|uniref:DHA2 family efflux MFS transporter permease subunit n=1 Tax=Amycolatopsis sp. A1MSW2902 TaxID=687413 RepID=UPI00068F71AE
MSEPALNPRRWAILAVLLTSFLLTVLDATIVTIAFRALADPVDGLGASADQLQWVVNGFTLVYAGLLLAWGVLGDRLGHRKVLLIGLVVFGVSSVLAAFAHSPGELVLWRVVMGAGGAAIPPTTLATISHVFGDKERPRAIGYWVSAAGIAAVVAPVLGGFLIQFAWWGSIFLVNGPIVLAAIVLTVLMVPESTSTARKLDVPGVVLSVAWSTALVYGIIQAGNLATIADPRVYVPLVLGVVLLVVFVLVELRSAAPALDLRLVSDRRVAGATSAVSLAFFVNFGVPFFLIFYLQSVLGVSPLMTGLAILPLALALAVFSPRSATLSAKFGTKNVLVGGLLLLAVGVAIFALLDQNSPLWPVFVADFLVGLAMANVMPPATTTIMSAVPRERAGVGSALTNMGRSIGGAIGIAVLGSLLTVVYRNGVEPALSVLPEQSRAAAGDSIEATKAAAAGLGGNQGTDLFAAGADAFSVAMRTTALAAAGAAVLAAIVVLVVVPARERRTAEVS